MEPEELRAAGIKAVILDLDNTIVPWRGRTPARELFAWLDRFREADMPICIVSNNGSERVWKFADTIRVPAIPNARKPGRKAFRQALALLGTKPSETAVIGDQLFTDVLGGNRLGLFTILVQPIDQREFIGTRLVRQVERRVLAWLRKRGWLS